MPSPKETGVKWLLIIVVIIVTLLAIVGTLTLLTLLILWGCTLDPSNCIM